VFSEKPHLAQKALNRRATAATRKGACPSGATMPRVRRKRR